MIAHYCPRPDGTDPAVRTSLCGVACIVNPPDDGWRFEAGVSAPHRVTCAACLEAIAREDVENDRPLFDHERAPDRDSAEGRLL